jgi:hypothetical protein
MQQSRLWLVDTERDMSMDRSLLIVSISALMGSVHWATAQGRSRVRSLRNRSRRESREDISAGAQGLLKAIAGNLKGEVNKTVVNLWEKYPNADRIAIVQNLESSSCYLVRDSTLSDKEKISAWTQMLQQFSGYLSPK